MNVQDMCVLIDDWYVESKAKLTKILNEDSEPFRTPADIQKPLQIMQYAMECEGMLIQLMTRGLSLFDAEDMEHKLRGIRDTIARLVSDSIVRGLNIYGYQPSDYGIHVEMMENGGFCLEIPYEMIAMSDLFMLRSKRIASLTSLSTVREAWVGLISSVCEQIRRNNPSAYPFHFSNIEVCIEMEHKLPLDPDHFWVRPIIDGFWEMGIIEDDNAKSLNFMQTYKLCQANNRVFIKVTSLTPINL